MPKFTKLKQRKKDHLELALLSQTGIQTKDRRFVYEPLFTAHPTKKDEPFEFMGKTMRLPIWISSMTGGTEYAGHINRNLAKACREFGMGMGLGSCRVILNDDTYFEQFNVRKYIGKEQPLYANLGISQIEIALKNKDLGPILRMVEQLDADGLFIHVNPLQEWLQPEGDLIERPPIETIQEFVEKSTIPVAVKEVGQGFGYESLKALLKMPLEAVEFGAFGGTNFAKIELERSEPIRKKLLEPLSLVGNDTYQMLDWANDICEKEQIHCKYLILSGGVKSYLDGYYLVEKSKLPAAYGMASPFLQHARVGYDMLQEFVSYQADGYRVAKSYLRLNPDFISD